MKRVHENMRFLWWCYWWKPRRHMGAVQLRQPKLAREVAIIGLPLALTVLPQVYGFPVDAMLELVEPGLTARAIGSTETPTTQLPSRLAV